jgi:hypothetical protein
MEVKCETTIGDILAEYPQPWGVQHGAHYAITNTGYSAVSLILIHFGYVDCVTAAQHAGAADQKLFVLEMAKAAASFLAQKPHIECVPGIPAAGLAVLVALFKIQCLYKAGAVDQHGEPVN